VVLHLLVDDGNRSSFGYALLLRSLDAEQSQETKQSRGYLEEFKFFLCANYVTF